MQWLSSKGESADITEELDQVIRKQASINPVEGLMVIA